MNLSTATPAEVDTRLAALYEAEAVAERAAASATSTFRSIIGDRGTYASRSRKVYRTSALAAREEATALFLALPVEDRDNEYGFARIGTRGMNVGQYRRAVDAADQAIALLASIRTEEATLNAEYARRPWTRFLRVTSSAGGHVHSSMHCSTCRPTTTYGWHPELSGKTEADAVAVLGPELCSVCYPSAPVAWTFQGRKAGA